MHLAQNFQNRVKTEKIHDAGTADIGCFIKVVVSVQNDYGLYSNGCLNISDRFHASSSKFSEPREN